MASSPLSRHSFFSAWGNLLLQNHFRTQFIWVSVHFGCWQVCCSCSGTRGFWYQLWNWVCSTPLKVRFVHLGLQSEGWWHFMDLILIFVAVFNRKSLSLHFLDPWVTATADWLFAPPFPQLPHGCREQFLLLCTTYGHVPVTNSTASLGWSISRQWITAARNLLLYKSYFLQQLN